MKVADVMTTDVVTARRTANIREIAELMERHNVGTVIITDASGKLEGLVTDRKIVTDCIAKGYDPSSCRVEDIMTKGAAGVTAGGAMGMVPGVLVTANPDEDIMDVAHTLGDKKIRRMPVVSNGQVVGIVSLADMARELKDAVSGFFEEAAKAEK